MHRFYASSENIVGNNLTLEADETRHLRDVLRMSVEDEVSVFNGGGAEFRCKILEIGKRSSLLRISEEIEPASPESNLDLTLAAAIVNGEKYDLVIQKAVELGVTTFVPLQTIRCDVKLMDAVKRLDRWRRIALEATKQCGRAKLMRVAEPCVFEAIVGGTDPQNVILFSEREGKTFSTVSAGKKITALIGPKGGWDDSELEKARSSGVNIVTLGGRILRAETAAISLTTILQHRFGDLN